MSDEIEFLTRAEVEAMVKLKRSAIADRVKAGTFPQPIRHSRTSVVWTRAAVQAWMRDLAGESSPAPSPASSAPREAASAS